jgi:uncharacterized protein
VKIVVDTNVFISGVFSGGPPYEILNAWRLGKVEFIISPEILEEYQSVGERLSEAFQGVDLEPFLELVTARAIMIHAPELPERICDDPADDKFLACAIAGRANVIVSEDKRLIHVSGYRSIGVLTPRAFLDTHLRQKAGK